MQMLLDALDSVFIQHNANDALRNDVRSVLSELIRPVASGYSQTKPKDLKAEFKKQLCVSSIADAISTRGFMQDAVNTSRSSDDVEIHECIVWAVMQEREEVDAVVEGRLVIDAEQT